MLHLSPSQHLKKIFFEAGSYSPDWLGACYVAQADLELMIFLCVPPCLALLSPLCSPKYYYHRLLGRATCIKSLRAMDEDFWYGSEQETK
jgi:hypothetical protein